MPDGSHLDPRASRRALFDQAQAWSDDVNAEIRASRRIAYIIAAVAVLIAALEALALLALTPLKTVVPYTIMVDRSTGFVETLRPLAPGPIAKSEAVTQAYLAQYVMARETFDATDLRRAYGLVTLWSGDEAKRLYVAQMDRSNASSPLNRFGARDTVSVAIKSISPLNDKAALVRFETVTQPTGAKPERPQAWVAVIGFDYVDAPMKTKDRLLNPLGFRVTRYRRDAEMASASVQPEPAPAQAIEATGAGL